MKKSHKRMIIIILMIIIYIIMHLYFNNKSDLPNLLINIILAKD